MTRKLDSKVLALKLGEGSPKAIATETVDQAADVLHGYLVDVYDASIPMRTNRQSNHRPVH